MTYREPARTVATDVRVVKPIVDYHDFVRWGAILAGLFMIISTQLVLSAIGSAIGFGLAAGGNNVNPVGIGTGIWVLICLVLSMFMGGWLMARGCGPINRQTALLNGAILWGLTLALSAWLLASGIMGTLGTVAANTGEVINQLPPGSLPDPANVNPVPVRDLAGNAAQATGSFVLGSLLGLIATLIGAAVGARTHPRVQA